MKEIVDFQYFNVYEGIDSEEEYLAMVNSLLHYSILINFDKGVIVCLDKFMAHWIFKKENNIKY